jgi:hypothetical protein
MYLAPSGGSLIRILSEGNSGAWSGIAVRPDYSDPQMIVITAYQYGKLLTRQQVERVAEIRNTSAGYAATVLLREVVDRVRYLSMPNAPFEGGILAGQSFSPNGDAWSGLMALMNGSDGEVHVTNGGEVNWCGPLAYARRYDTLLIADGNFHRWSYSGSIENRVSEVVAGSGPEQYTARRGDAARDGWPGQIAIDGSASAAQRELEARSQETITIRGGVTSEHWSIRERDFVQVAVPRAGFTGRTHRCRVLARSLADGDELMMLDLEVVRPVVSTAVSGAGARQRPSWRPGLDGSGGSIAQQFALLLRVLGDGDTRQRVR